MGTEDKETLLEEKRIRKDERKKIRRKKRAKITLYIILLLIIILLILIGNGYIGLSPFEFYGDGSSPDKVTYEAPPQGESEAMSFTVIVEEEDYIFEEKSYDLEGIQLIINEKDQGISTIELVDKFANSKAFDTLITWLDENGLTYNITTDYVVE